MSCLILILLWSGEVLDHFQMGNSFYEQGDYQSAIVHYDSAVFILPTAAVYYNRGNAYFKLGRIGLAIADYLRARAIAPNDADIKHNLEFARQFRVDKNPNPEGFFARFLRQLATVSNYQLSRFLSALLFLLFGLVFAFYLITRQTLPLVFSILLLVLFGYFLISVFYWRGVTGENVAVVVVPEAVLRSGPGEEYKEIVAVHDGLEVRIIERRQEWALIQIPGGLGGWVEKGKIEPVFVKPLL